MCLNMLSLYIINYVCSLKLCVLQLQGQQLLVKNIYILPNCPLILIRVAKYVNKHNHITSTYIPSESVLILYTKYLLQNALVVGYNIELRTKVYIAYTLNLSWSKLCLSTAVAQNLLSNVTV